MLSDERLRWIETSNSAGWVLGPSDARELAGRVLKVEAELRAIHGRAEKWADDDTITGSVVRVVVHGDGAQAPVERRYSEEEEYVRKAAVAVLENPSGNAGVRYVDCCAGAIDELLSRLRGGEQAPTPARRYSEEEVVAFAATALLDALGVDGDADGTRLELLRRLRGGAPFHDAVCGDDSEVVK